jgi:cytidylate kinase
MSGPGRRLVAVDGPAASGKTTLARRLALHFGLDFLDTGLLYRAVAWKLLRADRPFTDLESAVAAARTVTAEDLDPVRLRIDALSQGASVVAVIPEVRQALLGFQRRFGGHGPGAVLAGRDIGTVVRPDASHKIFVTATVEERARRRCRELQALGVRIIYDEVLANLQERDARDRQRAVAPLAPASDAFVIDTTEQDIDTAFESARAYVAAPARV